MKILAIETSCDETAAAIVEDGTKILSNVIASSVILHQKFGGIIPEVAAREQLKYIIPVLEQSCKPLVKMTKVSAKRGGKKNLLFDSLSNHIDAIAVTIGPGLIGSLLIGVGAAKTLSFALNKVIVPVNHLLGHLFANFLNSDLNKNVGLPSKCLPAVCLIASGGHTELILMQGLAQFKLLGNTRDDASGEAFDKTARIIGLGFPGGPAIQRTAEKIHLDKFLFPRPMIKSNNFDFSFSGLKTAVLYKVRDLTKKSRLNTKLRQELAFSIQEAIVDVLVYKTIKAVKQFRACSILLGGGVTANGRLRDKLAMQVKKEAFKTKLFIPQPSLCTDNAAVIASAAYYNFKPVKWQKITVQPSLEFPYQ